MVFGNTSIGSLQSVPEDHSPKRTGLLEGGEGHDRRLAEGSGSQDRRLAEGSGSQDRRLAEGSGSQNRRLAEGSGSQDRRLAEGSGSQDRRLAEGSGSQDRSRLCESSSKRQREQSSEASPSHTVTEGSAGGDTPHRPDRAHRLKRKRVSNASLDVEETAGTEASSVTSTQLSRLGENVEEAGHEEKPSPVNLETDKNKRTLHKNVQESKSKKQYTSKNVELEEESSQFQKMESEQSSEQSKNGGKRKVVQAKSVESDCSRLGSPILRSSPRKGPHTPRKQEPGLDGSVAGKVRTPQKRGHQTPQKQADVEEEELPYSPVYKPTDPSTFMPTFVLIRKLRSTKSGVLRDAKEEGPSAVKTSRRSLLQDDAQPRPSGIPTAEREGLESRSRKSAALTNTESPPSESKDGPSGNESLSASEEKPASQNKESEERLGSGSKERSESSRERSTSKSEEKRPVLGSETRSASRSEEKRPVLGSETRSASRSEERSASGSKDKASKERSRRKERSTTESKTRSSSPDEGRKTRSQSNQSRRTSKRLGKSKETTREDEVPKSDCRSSDSCVTDDVSRQSLQALSSNCSRQTADGARNDATHGLRIKLVRSPYSRVSYQTATKKVKLNHSWQLLSDNSMSRLLRSDTEVSSFDGFHGDDPLPSDLTYVSASEVEVTDDEDRVWLIDEEERELDQREGNQVSESLRTFIPTFSSPGKSNSSWDTACDLYVSQSVEQQLKCRQKAPGSPRKDSSVQSPKRQHASSGRQNAKNVAKKRKLKRRAKDKSNPEVGGTLTSTKRESKNGILCESETLMRVDKEILFSYNSPCKRQPAGPASPLKVWNGDLKEVLHHSPKQSRHCALPAKPPPPAFKL